MAKIVNREQMKGHILAAALTVYQKSGLHAASVSDIAEAAGMAKGTLYLYFKSKEELTISLCQHLFTGAEEKYLCDGYFDNIDQFCDHLYSSMDISQEQASFLPVFFEVFGPSFSSGDFVASVAAFFDKLGRFYADQIEHLQKTGQINSSIDAKTTGRALAAAFDGVILHRGLFSIPVDQHRAMIKSLLSVIKAGFTPT